jgi:hypothetical protein
VIVSSIHFTAPAAGLGISSGTESETGVGSGAAVGATGAEVGFGSLLSAT